MDKKSFVYGMITTITLLSIVGFGIAQVSIQTREAAVKNIKDAIGLIDEKRVLNEDDIKAVSEKSILVIERDIKNIDYKKCLKECDVFIIKP
jgi:hypothetical protein